MNTKESRRLFAKAQKVIPGGVNSPVRAFRNVNGEPLFFRAGEGAWLTDADGNRYVDYVAAFGPLILGHGHPAVLAALQTQLQQGLGYGACTAAEVDLAERLCELLPALEQVRLVTSGTEATMSAIRLARGFTGRDSVVKFEGCYHGHADGLLVKAGSGALTHGKPDSAGVPPAYSSLTHVLPYNDADAVSQLFAEAGNNIACIIVEPVAGNMNCVPPVEGFLQHLRQVCTQYGALLIFDEVMTGFRVGLGGAQGRYGVSPDLMTLGKVIGGGLPVGAFGGRREVMAQVAPLGPVYQAGTLSGSPLAVAAGLAMLQVISEPGFYENLEARAAGLLAELRQLAQTAGVPFTTTHVGAMFGCFFCEAVPAGEEENPISTFQQVMACDSARFQTFFHAMLAGGVYLAPSPYEAAFISAAHGDAEIEHTLKAAAAAFKAVAKSMK